MSIPQSSDSPTVIDIHVQHVDRLADVRRTTRLGEEIAGRLRRGMQRQGLTVRALAERAHVTPPTVMRVRNGGGARMDAGLLADVAMALGVRPGWLVYGEGGEPEWGELADGA